MIDLAGLRGALDGEALAPGSPGYEAARRPANPAYWHVHPQLVIRCRSVSDVARAIDRAGRTGTRLVARSGGHCFAGRSSTDGIVLDLAWLDTITVADDGIATIGAGARLAQVYAALHEHGRTIPAGCGDTVGIAGLTLGGGIGLLGRKHGLTCDRLVGARVVLADGRIVATDHDREPDLFWALRGAGGGQFGVVTELIFDSVAEPTTTRLEVRWSDIALERLIAAWQAWAPDAPENLTANLTVVAEPGHPVQATLFGASLLDEGATRELLREFTAMAGADGAMDLHGGLSYSELKNTFKDLDPRDDAEPALGIRSEFFSHPMRRSTIASLIALLTDGMSPLRRQLTFTAMGGAYNRTAESATAFAHRSERYLLEHIAEAPDTWIDRSWAIAHADGSGRIYPNFPDTQLDNPATAYHAGNYPRLTAVKNTYDPHRFFDFPQSI
jgi:FAD/FMN-containing dehydrogenase